MQAKSMNILAMAAFGTLAIFVRGIALSPLEIALWRGVIAILVLLVLRLVTPKRPDSRLTWRERGLLLLSGVAVGINWALLFAAYDHTSIAVATLSYYFAPVLVMILSPILFHERMTTLQFTCFLAATLGLVLVVAGGQDLSLGNLLGVALGLGAACFYAAVVLLNKQIRGGTGLDRTLWQFAGSCAALLPLLLFRGDFGIAGCDVSSFGNLLIVGVVHTGLCYWLYFTSIRDLPGPQTAILSYIDPLVAILVSVFVFRESATLVQWLGAALILGFTCLYQWTGASKAAKN